MRYSLPLTSAALLIGLAGMMLISLTTGALELPAGQSLLAVFDQIFATQWHSLNTYQQAVVLELRLPRVLLALACGVLLAQTGAVMQGLFRNPLADPGIIGVASGAAVGAICAIVLLPAGYPFAVPVAAFAGGLLTTLLVYRLAQSRNGTSVLVLLLAGVAISALGGALIGFMSYFADDQDLRQLSLWQMGTLSAANDYYIMLTSCAALLLACAFQRRARALNALLLGEASARYLGIKVEHLKLELILLTAIGVGIAVASAGIIGFVGLVVPHLVRLATGPDHRSLLLLSALCGALLLLVADLLARTLVQPAELPVGLVTALLGAPFFLLLLLQQRQRG